MARLSINRNVCKFDVGPDASLQGADLRQA